MPKQSFHSTSLGTVIRSAREAHHLSIRDLADQTNISSSMLLFIEQDKVSSPNPTTLQALAEALGLNLVDVYAAAGYVQPKGLPSFTPYLRSKYRDLPDEARAELEESFVRVAKKYGYDGAGPAPGEDEH